MNHEDAMFNQVEEMEQQYLKNMRDNLEQKPNPLRILVKIVRENHDSQVLAEATQAIKNLARNKSVVDMLMNDQTKDLPQMFRLRFLPSGDPQIQCNLLEAVCHACTYKEYAREFLKDDEFLKAVESKALELPLVGVLFSFKVFRLLC